MSIETILNLLADGEFHSGSEIGEASGVSRAAVWKQIKKLEELGLQPESVKGKGYRLAYPIDLLDPAKIQPHLGEAHYLLPKLEILQQTDSTNNVIQQRILDQAESGHTCLAEFQTAGRGRRGRAWVSPFASNIYMSVLWRFSGGAAALEGLSLAIGVAIVDALREAGIADLELKWPNDVLHQGRKLAGILLEMSGDAAGPCAVVIGIGVNVHMPKQQAADIDQPWVDLYTLLNHQVSRNQIAGLLIRHVLVTLKQFSISGFSNFHKQWSALDAFYDHEVQLSTVGQTLHGIAKGVDHTGALILELEDGEQKQINGGEVSLRKVSDAAD